MTELKIASSIQADEKNVMRTYHYYLVIDSIEIEHFSRENYGIKVEEEDGEAVSIRRITPNAARIDALMSLIVRNTVSPTTFPNIVEDFL